jgi:hypothetical protein
VDKLAFSFDLLLTVCLPVGVAVCASLSLTRMLAVFKW